MFDDLDDGPRLGLWVAAGLLALALLGVVGGMALRQWRGEHSAAGASQASANKAVTTQSALNAPGAAPLKP